MPFLELNLMLNANGLSLPKGIAMGEVLGGVNQQKEARQRGSSNKGKKERPGKKIGKKT